MNQAPQISENKENSTLILSGDFTLQNSTSIEKKLNTEFNEVRHIDLREVVRYDSFLLIAVKMIKEFAPEAQIIFANGKMESFFKFFNKERESNPKLRKKSHFFEGIGEWAFTILADVKYFFEFNGNLALRIFKIFLFQSKIRWSDLPYHFLNSGVNAFAIVFLILLLIGLITGYQGAVQLRDFGADSYLAPLVGISITRELSPLMTAIIVSGRSGSAFAAEIGTMKVSEELDSLKVLGYNIYDFLILPRILAVTISVPILTILGDLAGLTGGAIAGYTTLDLTINSYINSLQSSLSYAHVFSGVLKAVFFGYLIGLVGCFRGTQVGSGADSVGRLTTSSVVTSIFLIIISDAVFTFIFQVIGF